MIKSNELKSNELRIGNLFYLWDDGTMGNKVHVVYEINEYELNGFKSKLREADPIPLTEEWLLKLGFTRVDYFYYLPNSMGDWNVSWNGHQFIVWNDCQDQRLLNIPVDYVHQLQNLIFALTGEELTIKEKSA